jgi:hypothetical protein
VALIDNETGNLATSVSDPDLKVIVVSLTSGEPVCKRKLPVESGAAPNDDGLHAVASPRLIKEAFFERHAHRTSTESPWK